MPLGGVLDFMPDVGRDSVLIVDDSDANIDILVTLLTPHYYVRVAKDGEKAIEIARAAPPDVMLLDIIMPGMNGYEVCKRLKAETRTKNINVIFVSAKGEIDDKMDGYEAGGVGYITKPIDPDFVLQIVRKNMVD